MHLHSLSNRKQLSQRKDSFVCENVKGPTVDTITQRRELLRTEFITMSPLSSPRRCGYQFVQQNSSERAIATLLGFRTPPKSRLPTDSFIAEIQCKLCIEETSDCNGPNSPPKKEVRSNNRKQEEHTESQSPPLPTYQSQRHLHDFPSSDEPPDTDPDFTQALWSEVTSVSMSSSAKLVPTEEYDPPSFSSPAFSEVLECHQVAIIEDLTRLKTENFWFCIREAVEVAPVEVVSELESCKVWEDNIESTKAKISATANTEDLAAKLEALLADPDSAPIECYQFITSQILGSCPLPGVKLYNYRKMFSPGSEQYHLIPNSRILTRPIVKKPTPLPGSVRSSTLLRGAQRRAAPTMKIAAQPTKVDPTRELKLNLPRDPTDCAYWLEVSELHPLKAILIAQETFVSNGTNRKTSPYLSIAFDRIVFDECGSFTEKQLLVKQKIAVYGSTALYNRNLLYTKALKIDQNSMGSITQLKKSACILHFGLAIVGKEATLYVFRCEEGNQKETDQATVWQGCNMSKVGRWILTAPGHLADMFQHLQIIADWVKRVYVPALHDDLTRSIGY